MPDQPFDVRKAIDQSAAKTTLQELAKKGIHRVKVLDEQMIQKLIRDAVENILGSRAGLLSDAEREKVVQKSRQELDRLIREFKETKDRAELLTHDKNDLAATVENLQQQLKVQRQLGEQVAAKRENELRAEFAQREREYNQRIQAEMQKNFEMSQKMTTTLEEARSHEDELFKKMEQLFTKSLEGLNKKLTDLRLRAVAGGVGAGVAGGEFEGVELRPSQATIESLFSKELESNLKAMSSEGKVAGKIGGALERLKALRQGGSEKPKDEGGKEPS